MKRAEPSSHPVRAASGISPIEAGYGLVHADTIVATTVDRLIVDPPSDGFELSVGPKKTSSDIAGLGLSAGAYDASIRLTAVDGSAASKRVTLILADPSRIRRRFGARYGSLEYDMPVIVGRGRTVPWERLWKTNEVSDIVVDFPEPYKLVLWRGMSFTPSWALDNVMTSFFFAETVEPGVFRDCCEMMSDRECRYSHARIIHASNARVVIHWRYALGDGAYTICRNQWVDELYYVHPDGTACRNVTIHLDPDDRDVWQIDPRTGMRVPFSMIGAPAGKRTFNDMEFITVNPAGSTSEENMPEGALTLLDGGEFERTFTWPNAPDFGVEPFPDLEDYIFRINYRRRAGAFVACPAGGLRVRLQDNTGMRYVAGALVQDDRWETVTDLPGRFADFIHWPITRGHGTTALTDPAVYGERPTHTFLGYANNAPVKSLGNGAVTWSWLTGIAPGDERLLRSAVRAWTSPPPIEGVWYDRTQRAYVFPNPGSGDALRVNAARGVVSPTFVLKGWEGEAVEVLVDGKPVDPGSTAIGIEQTIDGVQTVVTLRRVLPPSSTVAFRKGKIA